MTVSSLILRVPTSAARAHGAMLSEPRAALDSLVLQLERRVRAARDDGEARRIFRAGFEQIRSRLALYPVVASQPSAVFESVVHGVRNLAAACLPLGLAVAMHCYALCALRCIPMPWMHPARLQRAALLRRIRDQALVVANAGSERSRGTNAILTATRERGDVFIDGRCEYMSLASVSDMVMVKAQGPEGSSVLCAADLRAPSVEMGEWKFRDSMRLADTSAITFVNHRVPRGRYVVLEADRGFQAVSDYQRCWFHLFLVEVYLARIERLHHVWSLGRSQEHALAIVELSHLREHALHLFEDGDVSAALNLTSALKLRTSWLAQATALALRELATQQSAESSELQAHASELAYIRFQPTSDDHIRAALGI